MSALAKLAEVRKLGQKPAAVMLTLYPARQPQWWREDTPVEIVLDADVARIDLRPLIGCDVVIVADGQSDRLRNLTQQVQQYAKTICVLPGGEDGFSWSRESGWRRFGDRSVMGVA